MKHCTAIPAMTQNCDKWQWIKWLPVSHCEKQKSQLKISSSCLPKGQIKPKADWGAVDSPKKTNRWIWFVSHEE